MTYDLNYLVLVSIFVFGYFLGSIPFGLILTKISGLGDIRKIGSGNIGATNVLRTGNKKIALLTLLLDGLKGAIAIYLITIFLHSILKNDFNKIEFYQCTVAVSAVLGHCFPIWLKFKGGKGVATYLGILFAINFYFGIIFIVSWFITFFISKFSSLSSLIGAASIPIYLLFLSQFDQVIFFTIMFVLIFFTHRENIKRLKNKEETKTKIY